ncbi:hypothetical protein AYO41_04055 [Verrucomicrobia bacterium SCGC AG-212-E04]|nr:hypothetical protein AYO41_04055 [Verrucomicrobia bacterium SCGC AG-212-E04]
MTTRRLARICAKATLSFKAGYRVLRGFDDSMSRCASKLSFSQCGEDLIAWHLFSGIGVPRPTYLDIGAHHPTLLSNTALFYLLGSHGINIEPDPVLFSQIASHRRRDTNLNIGIAREPGDLAFFRMSDSSLSTFSVTEANRLESQENIPILKRLTLPVWTAADVLTIHSFVPDFVSIDVEGNDLEVLESFQLEVNRPKVFCVETLTFSTKGDGKKNKDIPRFMENHGYVPYADTYLNTLFVDEQQHPRVVLERAGSE